MKKCICIFAFLIIIFLCSCQTAPQPSEHESLKIGENSTFDQYSDTGYNNETNPIEPKQVKTTKTNLEEVERWISESGNIEFYVSRESAIDCWDSWEGKYTDPNNMTYDIIIESSGLSIWNEEKNGHLLIYAYHYEYEEFEDETLAQKVMVPEEILCGDFVFGETKDEIFLTVQGLKENFIHKEYSDGDVVRFYHVK